MSADTTTGITSQIGPWGMVPAWVLLAKDAHGKGMSGADLRVYVALRTFADREGKAFPHVQTIAERADVSQRAAERSIAHLRDMELLSTRRRYRADGSISRCDYVLTDIKPVSAGEGVPTGLSVPPGEIGGTSRRSGRSNNTPLDHPTKTHHKTQWSTSSKRTRFVREYDDDWRQQDLDLFAELIEAEKFESDGSVYAEGVVSVEDFYHDLHTGKVKQVDWPGRYVQKISANGTDGWLNEYGLDRPW
jgi:hypothetical protein